MLVGLFADTHDHLANIRLAVQRFNAARCGVVLFAGDLVSTFAVPPLRKLNCPLVGCFGDNEGNKVGLLAGFTLVGQMGEPPVRFAAVDGPGAIKMALTGHDILPHLRSTHFMRQLSFDRNRRW